LDIVVVYFPTGTRSKDPESDGDLISLREERSRLRGKLSGALTTPSKALTLLMGDFNTVVHDDDRINPLAQTETGRRDAVEEEHWRNAVARKFDMYELEQPLATYQEGGTRSRIDRVYTNQPPSDQLDKRVGCAALEWVPKLSAHRAITCVRAEKSHSINPNSAIPDWVLDHQRFPRLVASRFWENAVVLKKKAIHPFLLSCS